MITMNDFESAISSLVNNEIDTVVISDALARNCGKAFEVIKNFVSFKVLRCTSSSGEIIKGVISYDDMKASVELDLIDEKYIMRSFKTIN